MEEHFWELFGSPASQGCGFALLYRQPPQPLLPAGPPPSSSGLAGAPSRPRLRPRPAADVSCYVSARAAVAAALLRRRLSRPREVTGTAAGVRSAHPSGAGTEWPGGNRIAAQGDVLSLFFPFFPPGPSLRAPHFPLQRSRRPLPGRAAVPVPPERRRPLAGENLELPPPPPCGPRFSRILGGRRGLGPGRRARRCGARFFSRWAPGLAGPSGASS